MKKIYVFLVMVFVSGGVWGQISITSSGTPFTQNFDAMLGTSATATLTTNQWRAADNAGGTTWAGANRTATTQIGGTAVAVSAGGVYNYGNGIAASATDRALGFLSSITAPWPGTTATPLSIYAQYNNATGSTITQLDGTFDIEKYRNGTNAQGFTINFYYSLDGSTWTAVASGNQTFPADANNSAVNPATTTSKTFSLTGLSITNGSNFYLRWSYLVTSGATASNAQGLAIDNVSVTATAGASSTPDIVLSSTNPSVAAGNITQGTSNNVIYQFNLAVSTTDAVLNGVTITTAGTYAASDITNFKCWYSADNVFNPASDVLLSTKTTALGTGSQVFPTFTNQLISNGTNGYIFITSNISCASTVSNNISVNAITTSDISFVSGNKTGTAFAGNAQTIIGATPNNVTGAAASIGNTASSVSWTAPTGCFDEILIVAATATNTGVPTGDGTAYTGSLTYGSGTVLGNGFVVYGGVSTSPQLVTGLANGTTYFYKLFTRFGTQWSSGVEVSATPASVTTATDYFRSVSSGSWASVSTWESSNDSTTWIPATLAPAGTAAHVVIQSPDSVYLATNTSTGNLTIKSGAIFNAITFTMTATVRFNLLGTATYYQGGTVGTVPGVQQVLSPTSNYHFNGTQAGVTATLPEFGNLIWEPTASGAGTFSNNNVTAPFYGGLVVHGNMTINIQGATPREVRFATGAAVSRKHTIDGNLNIISSSSVVVVQNGSSAVTSILNIGGDLIISAGVFQGTSSTAGTDGSAVVNLSGNINNTGGTIQTGSSTLGLFSLNYVGAAAQSINNAGGTISFTANQKDSINKSSGAVTLNTPITHLGTIRFISGILNTTATNILNLGVGSVVSDASNLSFVNGPVAKTGSTPFIFPVGKTGTGYVPVGIGSLTGSETFTAEYIRTDATTLGPISAIGLLNISRCEYWTLSRLGAVNADVTLNWTSVNNCAAVPYINSLPDLTVAHFDGANWDSYGAAGNTTGTTATGSVTWAGVSTFSPFTIGTVNFINPLAVSLNYLRGVKQGNTHLLNWKVTCASTPSATLSLERSADGTGFKPIYSITADALRCAQPFDYSDAQPLAGTNYYRLKMTDANGKISYSNIITLINASQGFDIMHIAPNPVTGNNFTLNISSAKATQMNIVISDLQGRVVKQASLSLIAGYNTSEINIQSLAPGTYQLYGSNGTDKSKLIRFVKQ